MYTHVYMCIYVYVCICVYMCIYIYAYIYIYIYVYIYIYICAHTYIHTCNWICYTLRLPTISSEENLDVFEESLVRGLKFNCCFEFKGVLN